MKKFLLLSIMGVSLLTAGCGFQDYVHTNEPRSTIYVGQTAADVYENFGRPTKIERIAQNKQILVYHKQEIEKDWSYRYFHECKLKFYMEDDRLVDWQKEGDICSVKELSSPPENSYFSAVQTQENGDFSEQKPIGALVPEDAFGSSQPEEEKSFFASLFSDEFEEEPAPVIEEQDFAYETENKNRVFIGYGVPTGKTYQNDTFDYMDIPDDAF